ncbi:transcriptional activator RfaH [Caenispirillum bisanense]|uniref:transcription termination/antitermination protein NusG n=1 Tax=Caenispirillum bisanense TaxID=414052 RepID=UPI0031E482AB
MTGWFVVFTHPAAEANAVSHLQRQGFATYLPRYRTTRRHARRQETVYCPLFPRYLFVALDLLTARWRPILSTVGVVDLLRHGDRPARIPDELIETLRVREAQGPIEPEAPAVPPLAPGDAVRIKTGPFAELAGRLESLADSERVRVLLTLLGCEVRAELPVSKVRAG